MFVDNTTSETFGGNIEAALDRPGFIRCIDLWYRDGSVVIQAGNVLFRVYSGILAQHSPFFYDLFSIPQPEHQDLYDGVPVVQVTDLAEDFRVFLIAMLDTSYSAISIDVGVKPLLALLRLSTKYLVHHIRKAVLLTLAKMFPLMAEDRKAATILRKATSLKENKGWEILAANCLRDHDAPFLLPGALLRCSTYPYQSIFDSQEIEGVDIHLNDANRRSIILAKPSIDRYIYAQISEFCRETQLRGVSKNCTTKQACLTARKSIFQKVQDGLYRQKYAASLLTITRILKSQRDSLNICRHCHEEEEELALEHPILRNLWNDLPGMFKLPPWEELHKQAAEEGIMTANT